ncbi:3-oxoacyl-[acyl-carrier-protein] synthase III C-terminal domain-containing protein [Myxococcus stipitatus]|uniref:3-oxoacyl-[acyl-carrier-protein] synthase III C-terminal domain-containing protein n=1 Tax=Myxococcus stipitatus TaxID=83455 RepID=UPI003CD013D2
MPTRPPGSLPIRGEKRGQTKLFPIRERGPVKPGNFNARSWEALLERQEIPRDKCRPKLHKYGNTPSASPPQVPDGAHRASRREPGDAGRWASAEGLGRREAALELSLGRDDSGG